MCRKLPWHMQGRLGAREFKSMLIEVSMSLELKTQNLTRTQKSLLSKLAKEAQMIELLIPAQFKKEQALTNLPLILISFQLKEAMIVAKNSSEPIQKSIPYFIH